MNFIYFHNSIPYQIDCHSVLKRKYNKRLDSSERDTYQLILMLPIQTKIAGHLFN